MTKEQREAAKARCNAATDGPWITTKSFRKDGRCGVETAWTYSNRIKKDGTPYKNARDVHCNIVSEFFFPSDMNDASFIAHARTDLPLALAEIDRLEAELARVTAERDAARLALAKCPGICE